MARTSGPRALKNAHSFETVFQLVNAGGDTDSTAAMAGALLGALHGKNILPQDLVKNLAGKDSIQKELELAFQTFR